MKVVAQIDIFQDMVLLTQTQKLKQEALAFISLMS